MTKNPNHVNAQNEREFSSSVSITDACTTSFDDIRGYFTNNSVKQALPKQKKNLIHCSHYNTKYLN